MWMALLLIFRIPQCIAFTRKGSYPISLLDVENDCGQMRERIVNIGIFFILLLARKLGLELGTNNLIYTVFILKTK